MNLFKKMKNKAKMEETKHENSTEQKTFRFFSLQYGIVSICPK